MSMKNIFKATVFSAVNLLMTTETVAQSPVKDKFPNETYISAGTSYLSGIRAAAYTQQPFALSAEFEKHKLVKANDFLSFPLYFAVQPYVPIAGKAGIEREHLRNYGTPQTRVTNDLGDVNAGVNARAGMMLPFILRSNTTGYFGYNLFARAMNTQNKSFAASYGLGPAVRIHTGRWNIGANLDVEPKQAVIQDAPYLQERPTTSLGASFHVVYSLNGMVKNKYPHPFENRNKRQLKKLERNGVDEVPVRKLGFSSDYQAIAP
jgi:hypothetical protein